MVGVDPDPDPETRTPGNVEVVSDDGFRKKHIRVHGLPTEALAVMNKMDRK